MGQPKPKPFILPLGRSRNGQPVNFDWFEYSSLLISGMDGYGKTTLLKEIVALLLNRNDLRLIIASPPSSQANDFGNPRNLLFPLITRPAELEKLFGWLEAEITRRYALLTKTFQINFIEYNKHHRTKLRPVIVVIDDFPLELLEKQSFRKGFIKLLTLARAAGIRLICAFPDEIFSTYKILDLTVHMLFQVSFRMRAKKYSNHLFGLPGAEQLRMPGQALYTNLKSPKPRSLRTKIIPK